MTSTTAAASTPRIRAKTARSGWRRAAASTRRATPPPHYSGRHRRPPTARAEPRSGQILSRTGSIWERGDQASPPTTGAARAPRRVAGQPRQEAPRQAAATLEPARALPPPAGRLSGVTAPSPNHHLPAAPPLDLLVPAAGNHHRSRAPATESRPRHPEPAREGRRGLAAACAARASPGHALRRRRGEEE